MMNEVQSDFLTLHCGKQCAWKKCVASCTFVATNILRISRPNSLLASRAGIILATRIIRFLLYGKENISVQG